ncbi:MAG: MarR family transcriptional regulator [Bacteroidia bacterium]|nr:MarR family transcriptional regulator [Bacteroidia bacterium]MDW8301125.1 MarR family transcriptional regulator [Bacteroidia bacterium]
MEKFNQQQVEILAKTLYHYNNAIKYFENQFYNIAQCTTDDFQIVMFLLEEGDTKISKVGVKFHIKLSSLTGIIDRLERLGYIERFFKPGDRRSTYIKAVESEKVHYLRKIMYQPAAQLILSRLNTKQINQAVNLFEAISKEIKNVSEEEVQQIAKQYEMDKLG